MITKTKDGMTIQGASAMQPKEFDYCFVLRLTVPKEYNMPPVAIISASQFETEEQCNAAIQNCVDTFFDYNLNSFDKDVFESKLDNMITKYGVTVVPFDMVSFVEGKDN